MSDALIKKDTKELVAAFSGFNAFLVQHGLPTENIIANEKERGNIANNLSAFLDEIPADVKKDARYLSKLEKIRDTAQFFSNHYHLPPTKTFHLKIIWKNIAFLL